MSAAEKTAGSDGFLALLELAPDDLLEGLIKLAPNASTSPREGREVLLEFTEELLVRLYVVREELRVRVLDREELDLLRRRLRLEETEELELLRRLGSSGWTERERPREVVPRSLPREDFDGMGSLSSNSNSYWTSLEDEAVDARLLSLTLSLLCLTRIAFSSGSSTMLPSGGSLGKPFGGRRERPPERPSGKLWVEESRPLPVRLLPLSTLCAEPSISPL